MNEQFSGAVNPSTAFKPLTMTTDWQGTLSDFRWNHLELLEFFSDVKKEGDRQKLAHGQELGHRVIITSSSSMDIIKDMLEMIIEKARMKGYDIVDVGQFELLTKKQMKEMDLYADVSFDNDPINNQPVPNYVRTALEIRVHPDFSTTPVSLEQLRTKYNIPSKGVDGVASAPAPAP